MVCESSLPIIEALRITRGAAVWIAPVSKHISEACLPAWLPGQPSECLYISQSHHFLTPSIHVDLRQFTYNSHHISHENLTNNHAHENGLPLFQ